MYIMKKGCEIISINALQIEIAVLVIIPSNKRVTCESVDWRNIIFVFSLYICIYIEHGYHVGAILDANCNLTPAEKLVYSHTVFNVVPGNTIK